jgi:cytochrome c oxidase subunit 2
MTGDDYHWVVRYPGRDGRLDTRDDVLDSRDLSVPEGTEVRVLLESLDFVYTLNLPEFGLKEIVVPDMAFELRLPASEPGSFQLLGDHLCGYDHPELIGTLVVRTRDDYERWLETAREER